VVTLDDELPGVFFSTSLSTEVVVLEDLILPENQFSQGSEGVLIESQKE
jgi:hypothetical protein